MPKNKIRKSLSTCQKQETHFKKLLQEANDKVDKLKIHVIEA
jgi:hypothetical protein